MHTISKPIEKPRVTKFMSGPCAKRPGYSLTNIDTSLLGRSRRADEPTARRREIIDRSARLLGMPADWRLAIIPGSDMGAMEAAMWNLLGPRPVDVLDSERFAHFWAEDVVDQLSLPKSRVLAAEPGQLPDLSQIDWSRDVVFVWNGTTAGTCMPDAEWIATDRAGLAICDATSAAFAMELPWDRLDAVTWSWQKVLGGEGAHGMLALSPRAIERLRTHRPPWPIPKLLRLTEKGRVLDSIFRGESINTPSQLCIEDALDALTWAEAVGGRPAMIQRTQANYATLAQWVERTPWVDYLAKDPVVRSHVSVCLVLMASWYRPLPSERRSAAAKRLAALLETEGVAHDIDANPSAPPGLRIWCGATVEASDIRALLPWLDWAHEQVAAEFSTASTPVRACEAVA
jgi:phosphoserine aminotransferase